MHRGEMLGTVAAAASVLALAACGDESNPSVGVPRSALLALARADGAAPAPAVTVVPVKYNQSRITRIVHPDAGGTLFIELFFPAQAILRVNGQPVCDTCTVSVGVSATPGVYGFTLSPATMIFNASSTPTVTFGYATYGDLSVYDSSSTYPTTQSFDQALAVWVEFLPGEWRRGRNSSHTGPGLVVSGLEGPGAHVLAAPK